ncbi:oxygenase MpaB family protein [Microbacterium rhizosphaerae]|uniref:Oxygenase MpaB family protein n=1 Tax=Microbacterium rhizosphaerae TaxID=1678237 RepID=A0ABZ0SR04_9MICO|nr:oxygenase MpaB family protein [Microbacterium rhizosphaerae]WPR90243.1 oxygenase MpaB family protein [Microbacterium rhizosphaerae]
MTRLPLRARLLTALAGDPDGTPPWVRALADGHDGGYFPDGGAVWTVHAGTATFVAGIRALLIQALHPGAMAGVHDFSRYREDPVGRLSGTVRWIICVTYGSTEQADAETARVSRLHQRVAGTYSTDTGLRTYSASDASLVEWVHLAFTEAFLGAHQRWGGPIPGGADAYVREWAQAGRLMRVLDPPETEAELRSRMDAYLDRGELKYDARVADIVQFLRDVPFTGSMRLAYRVLFAAAVASLPRRYRKLLGLRRTVLPVVTSTRAVLAISSRALGSGPRAQDFARRRHQRLQHEIGAGTTAIE